MDAAGVQLNGSVATVARDPDVAPGVYTVRETAGPVSLDVAAWPLRAGVARIVDAVVPGLARIASRRWPSPNPHLVTFVDTIDEAELVRVGTLCEAAPDWLPNRANVSFVTVKADAIFVPHLRTRGRGDRQLRQRDGGVDLCRLPERSQGVRHAGDGAQPGGWCAPWRAWTGW